MLQVRQHREAVWCSARLQSSKYVDSVVGGSALMSEIKYDEKPPSKADLENSVRSIAT